MIAPSSIDFINETLVSAGKELETRFGHKREIQRKSDLSIVTDADLASEKIILDRIRKYFPTHNFYSEESGLSKTQRNEGEWFWVIDPLDGTSNFANDYPFFCVSIALCQVDTHKKLSPVAGGIYDPIKQNTYLAEKSKGAQLNGKKISVRENRRIEDSFLVTGFYYKKGEELTREIERFSKVADLCPSIRRDGAAALDLALVAEGVFDAFWEHGLQPWDLAAGILLVQEAGGYVWNYNAGNSRLYDLEGEGVIAGNRSIVSDLYQKLGLPS